MELQYIVLTIIKILISVPAILVLINQEVDAAALIGGHVKNNVSKISKINTTDSYDFKIDLSDEYTQEIADNTTEAGSSEEVPDPSPLIVPGYNLPENIFNHGKPFYLEKDPLTGSVDFDSKTPTLKVYDDYEYEEDLPYDKSQIDRKDGPISGSHKPSDINQLTPNFHDFLNLPVKYNPDKYVYPLISSSYANTKVQGNVNKHHNHKNYEVTTYKPTLSPTYFTTKKFYTQNKVIEYIPKEIPKNKYKLESTTRPVSTTTTTTTTTKTSNLMNSPMNHPSFGEEFRPTPSTTTKRTMSLFEQLFGSDYDDSTTEVITTKAIPPKLFDNLPSNKKATTTQNVLTGSNMSYSDEATTSKKDQDDYEYEYDYQDKTSTTSQAKTSQAITSPDTTSLATTITMGTSSTTTTVRSTSPTKKVTSLPLGENHVTHFQPVISSTNLREKLNAEKVPEHKFVHHKVPSASNIHIAPDQDIVSFVVGNHQNVEGGGAGSYVGTSLKESPYDNNPFRPVYNLAPPPEEPLKYQPLYQSSTVAIQPMHPIRNAEASLAIGAPINGELIKPGQVVDEVIESVEYPKVSNKIVFPIDRPTTYSPDLSPPPPPLQQLNREVLKLSSKPMFHQLPSDLTPPSEKESIVPQRLDRVRPPWDPRPGHFHAGRPEYARPPRPVPELYKRIDNLPNILPQFRPNMNVHHSHPHHHHHHYPNKNYARQPLLDRPSNRPIGFFEKLHPPPLNKNDQKVIEDRVGHGSNKNLLQEPFAFLQAPPKIVVPNRRNGEDIETLQMIQAKKDKVEPAMSSISTNLNGKDTLEKPLYVVYPVNTPPLKLDVIDPGKKESVVIGTRAELPLPPSKISQDKLLEPTGSDFNFEINERHDAPILKPRPGGFPLKTDFPYPLERPDPSMLNSESVDEIENNLPDEPILMSSNQWNTIEDSKARIVNTQHLIQNQISVTLKTHTEKPIAVAYTPTESNGNKDFVERYPENLNQEYAERYPEKHKDYTSGYQDRFPNRDHVDRVAEDNNADRFAEILNKEYSERFPEKQANGYPEKLNKNYPDRYPDISHERYPETPNKEYHDRYPENPNKEKPNKDQFPEKPSKDYTDRFPEILNKEYAERYPEATKEYQDRFSENNDRFSPPNYSGLVIPEIRPSANSNSEITVSAVMHARPQKVDRIDEETTIPAQDFQAPFQASVHIDHSISQGWSVVKNKEDHKDEVTTVAVATTSEFDIENFKPQLEGGFKPIYSFPEDQKDTLISERQE